MLYSHNIIGKLCVSNFAMPMYEVQRRGYKEWLVTYIKSVKFAIEGLIHTGS
jgi:hypothetical protein